MSVRTVPSYYSPLGFQKLIVDSVVGFTLPIEPPIVRAVQFSVETDQIRFRLDGVNPDASTGVLMEKGDSLQLTNRELIMNFRAIKVTAAATIQIHYFGGHF